MDTDNENDVQRMPIVPDHLPKSAYVKTDLGDVEVLYEEGKDK